MMATKSASAALFPDLTGEDADSGITDIESLCVNCFKNGRTRLLLTKIPFYKEVVLMSFQCEYCGYQNNEIQSASEIQPKGCRITLKVAHMNDLNRRIVKSDFASVKIPEVDFEIPSKSQKGEVTTIEGCISRAINGLQQDQEARRKDHPEIAKQIDEFISRLDALKSIPHEFTIILEDISGNSFIENLNAPKSDPNMQLQQFNRTEEQNKLLGMYPKEKPDDVASQSTGKSSDGSLLKNISEGSWLLEELHGEVLQFQTNCPECGVICETNMKLTNIPHFKDVVIMATVCEACGNKTNEVKSGGGIEPKGVRFEITVQSKEDLNRDVLKSETCCLSIPELECEVGAAALGGRFSTVEGILTAMRDQLVENSAIFQDSQEDETKQRFSRFIETVEKIIQLERTTTLVLDDPAGNSYVQSLRDDDVPDERLKIYRYERDFDQNEELGLNDMKTENY